MTKGERIRISREKIGLSQVELAEHIGVSKQNMYKYENNIITNIPSDKIEAMAEILGVSPSYIMGWNPLESNIEILPYSKIHNVSVEDIYQPNFKNYSKGNTITSLGERIKAARDNKGLKQSELADLIDVKSSGVISNWEKDINKPDADKIIKLCEVLNISASYLLDYYGGDIDITFEEKEKIKKYRKLDTHGKKVVDLVLNEEYERCTQDTTETPKSNYKIARAAAFGGGTADIPISADVSSDEITRMIDENKALQQRRKNEKVADELIEKIKKNK